MIENITACGKITYIRTVDEKTNTKDFWLKDGNEEPILCHIGDNIGTVINDIVPENGVFVRVTGKYDHDGVLVNIEVKKIEEWGRTCDHCGAHMTEGYYLAGEYACSEACAIELYDGDEAAFREDLSHAEEDNGEVYFTEW